jgi:cell division protein ZapB
MEADLKALEDKLKQLIVLCQSLREENQELRQDLAQAQDDVKQLKENMLEAGTRLEALLDRLPEESL